MKPLDHVRKLRGREALAVLAEFLEGLKPELYEHSNWANYQFKQWNHEGEAPCGTQACAAGWSTYLFDGLVLGLMGLVCVDRPHRGRLGWGDLASFFDITEIEVERIFGIEYDVEDIDRILLRTALQTAARIREVLSHE